MDEQRCERCSEVVTATNYGRACDKPGPQSGVICRACDAMDRAFEIRRDGESIADALARVGAECDQVI